LLTPVDCDILKLKSVGRKYAKISRASIIAFITRRYIFLLESVHKNTRKSRPEKQLFNVKAGVLGCNKGCFVMQKRHFLLLNSASFGG